jgi:hypothetical protein
MEISQFSFEFWLFFFPQAAKPYAHKLQLLQVLPMSTTAGITRMFLDSVRRDTLLVLLYVAHVFHSMCLDVSTLNCGRVGDKLKKIIK